MTALRPPASPPALALAGLLVAACGGGDGGGADGPPTADSASPPVEAAATTWETPREPYFHEVTGAAGIDFVHDTGAFGDKWLPETIGSGVVVLDADGDRRPDLLFVNGQGFRGQPGTPSAQEFYLNASSPEGGIRFRRATREWGLEALARTGLYCLGGAAGDLDGDGDHDLYLACLGRDRVLRNEGDRFVDATPGSGLTESYELGAGAVLFDADLDGDLDVLATRYVTWTPDDDLFCSLDGTTKTYCTPETYEGSSPRFYRNRGDATFEDRTVEAGVEVATMKAMGVALLDLGDDGLPDVAVAGDTQPNLLYKNRGDGTFEEVGAASGMAYSSIGTVRGGMGIDAADFDRSRRTGVVISYFAQEMVGLYANQGNEFFVDVASRSDLGPGTLLTLGWGTFFFDYDLDGWLDLFLANGHLDREVENVQDRIKYAQPQQLFRNLGDGDFHELTGPAAGDLAEPRVGRGAAFADFDGDGDPDLVVSTNGGPAALFENRGPRYGHWIEVHLEGTESNRDGVGAVVEVEAGGATQRWLVRTGGSYLSQSQIAPLFGLGEASVVDRLTVRWPSGSEQSFRDVEADRRLLVREGEAAVQPLEVLR